MFQFDVHDKSLYLHKCNYFDLNDSLNILESALDEKHHPRTQRIY